VVTGGKSDPGAPGVVAEAGVDTGLGLVLATRGMGLVLRGIGEDDGERDGGGRDGKPEPSGPAERGKLKLRVVGDRDEDEARRLCELAKRLGRLWGRLGTPEPNLKEENRSFSALSWVSDIVEMASICVREVNMLFVC
jgi:hypothetical protein